jgi:WXG100 family type VII secretion target
MSENDIYVSYGHVDNVEQVLEDSNNATMRVLEELQNVIQPMMASWAGSSVNAYADVQKRWTNDTNDMSNLLDRYRKTLDDMKINYGTTDNNLALQWADITGV